MQIVENEYNAFGCIKLSNQFQNFYEIIIAIGFFSSTNCSFNVLELFNSKKINMSNIYKIGKKNCKDKISQQIRIF